MLVSSIIIVGMGALVAQQVTQIGQKPPEYQFNIENKIAFPACCCAAAMLERISNFFRNINQEIQKNEKHTPTPHPQPQAREEPLKPCSRGDFPARANARGGHSADLPAAGRSPDHGRVSSSSS